MKPSEKLFAKVAVATATFTIDKSYEYAVPFSQRAFIEPGMRVLVPFGRSNRHSEGIVLSLSESSEYASPKKISVVLDKKPVLDERGIKLAAWMCRHYLCTLFEAASAALPAGLWHCVRQLWFASDSAKPDDLTMLDAETFRLISSSKDGIPEENLRQILGFDPTASLKRLSEAGFIIRGGSAKTNVKDKTDKVVKLAASGGELTEYLGGRAGKSPRVRALLEFLSRSGEVSVREACYFTGADSAIIKRLETAGVISTSRREAYRRPDIAAFDSDFDFSLNAEQQEAFDALAALVDKNEAAVSLLHGVTGSGKTQVYIRLIEKVVDAGGGAIILAPEIALTPQLVSRFAGLFGNRVALLHSALSEGERYDEWKRIHSGEAVVVVGTRSAVFAPVRGLRLIIIDEEHERAYKSDNAPRYHAREVAKFRSVQNNSLLLLGSATPSVESMYAAKTGKYGLITLPDRYNGRDMPDVLICDMREELKNGNPSTISSALCRELKSNIDRSEQSILFLNRRGDSRLVACISCGHIPGCHRCSVSMSYHSANNRLMCHYCGHSETPPEICPQCGGMIRRIGAGTQKVELDAAALFPGARTIRMDSDTTSTKNSHEKILSKFKDEHIPILVGTQMIAKGLDFEDVTLVGAISADQSLYTGSYRASERTFALITQVVGRAGRGGKPGRAVIQTLTPENPVLLCAASQDFGEFYNSEIELRESCNYPPFVDLCSITTVGADEDKAARASMFFRQNLDRAAYHHPHLKLSSIGPAPAGVLKVNNKFRYRVLTRCLNNRETRDILASLLRSFAGERDFVGVHAFADFDPE